MRKQLRVLYCSQGYSPHDFRFLSSLARTRHEVHWWRLEKNLVLENRPLPQNIQIVEWAENGQSNGWLNYPKLKNEFKKVLDLIQPDLVHAGPIQKVAFIAALAGFHPLISMSWGTDLLMEADRNLWWRWVTRFTLKHSDWLIGDCQAVQNKAAGFSFPKTKTSIFPWGIDLQRFQPNSSSSTRKKFGWNNNFVILCTRNWETRYGVELVVEAFCRSAGQMPDALLVLVGGGSQEKILRKMVLDARMQNQVVFSGRIEYEEIPKYYQAADLYISSSYSDGSSVSLMEALGCGCPVLVSDIVSNREWITPGKQGWLFKDGDSVDLEKTLLSIYRQRSKMKIIRENARQTALEKADWRKNFSILLSTYDVVTSKRLIENNVHEKQ
jgi:L-malate glycosyltransferase